MTQKKEIDVALDDLVESVVYGEKDALKLHEITLHLSPVEYMRIKKALQSQSNAGAVDDRKYYLRNKNAGYLGNSFMWYVKNGNGYTAYIQGAERFDRDKAESFVRHDPDKWEMYKCSDVDKRLHLVFDSQDAKNLGTDEKCGWTDGYAQNNHLKASDTIDGLMGTIESQKQTHDALIKKLRKYQDALRDTVQALDNCRALIGREVKNKIMPKEQTQAYDVLQKHAALIAAEMEKE